MKKFISIALCMIMIIGAFSSIAIGANDAHVSPTLDGKVTTNEYTYTSGELACVDQDISNSIYIIEKNEVVEKRTVEYLVSSDDKYIYIAYCGYGEMFSDLYIYLNPNISSGARDTVRLYLRAGWRDNGLMASDVQIFSGDNESISAGWNDYVKGFAYGAYDDNKLNENTIEIKILRSALSESDFDKLGICIYSRPEQTHSPNKQYGEWIWGADKKTSILPFADEFNKKIAGFHTFELSNEPSTSVDETTTDETDEPSAESPWKPERATPLEEYDFSIAVIGDTQVVSWYHTNPKDPKENILCHTYDWIIENKDEKKISFSIGLGDITEYDLDIEWEHTTEEIFKQDGVLPYLAIQGNHDSIAQYNRYMANETYMKQIKGVYKQGSVENAYTTFSASGIDFLVISLDYGPDDDVLAWAGKVIEDHPYHRVIIATHSYLYYSGKPGKPGESLQATADSESVSGGPDSNNGIDIWNEFASQYENIFLVLSGHIDADALVTTQLKGKNGNIVTQILCDPQHIDKVDRPTGMIAMLYFSEDGNKMQTEWYSPYQDMYYGDSNQYTIDLHIDDDKIPVVISDDQYDLGAFGQEHYYVGNPSSSPVADGVVNEGEYAVEIKNMTPFDDENDTRIYYLNNSNTKSDIENVNIYASYDESYIYLAAEVTDKAPNNYKDSVNFYIGASDNMDELTSFYIPRTPNGGVECFPYNWENTFDMTKSIAPQAEKASSSYVQAKKTKEQNGVVTYEIILKREAFSDAEFDKFFFGAKITTSDPTPRDMDVLYFGFEAEQISYKYPMYMTTRDRVPTHPHAVFLSEKPIETESETAPIETETTVTDIEQTEPISESETSTDADTSTGGCNASATSIISVLVFMLGIGIHFIKKKI